MEPHFHPLYATVFDRLGVQTGTRLLDVGCGPGGAAVLAAELGARAAGLDASARSIEVARERLPEGDFQVGDMETLPWPDNSFDVVTGFNSFPFARNPVAALGDARRVLVPGSPLGMVTFLPPGESQQSKVMAAISALAPPQPPNAPGPFALSSLSVMESVVEAAGLRLLDRDEITVVLEYPDADAACRAMMAGSGGVRAIQHVGAERVRQVILGALEPFRVETGAYRFENRFRLVIAS
jgi:SAM-dependent methyltransferase